MIAIDGLKCEDRTAPEHRQVQLLNSNSPALVYLKAKPPELKARIVDIAIDFEKRTAPLRKDDDVLCSGGTEEITAGIKAGKMQEIPTPKGGVGKTIGVDTPPGWVPKYVAPEVYKPLQERMRSVMKSHLLKLAE